MIMHNFFDLFSFVQISKMKQKAHYPKTHWDAHILSFYDPKRNNNTLFDINLKF